MSARAEALAVVQADAALRRLAELAAARLGDDPGHDLEHALRVAGWTLRLAPHASPRDCVAAALLHDVVNVAKDDPRRASASRLSAAEARAILPEHGFSADAISRIAEAIEDHSYSSGAVPRSPLGDALQDADRLEALGALGLMRTISTGVRMGARYFDSSDPFARERDLDDKRFSIDHFFTKLLRLPSTMRTPAGRAEAERRAAYLQDFLAALSSELGVPVNRPRAR